MTRKGVIRLARKAGLTGLVEAEVIENFEYLVALVAAAEREAICELADSLLRTSDAVTLIDAIRARGSK